MSENNFWKIIKNIINCTFSLPPRIAKDGEFMEWSHLLEVAFRSTQFDRDKDLELVETFYPTLYNLVQNDSRLIHNLVAYNKFDIFWKIVDGMTTEMNQGKAKNLKNKFQIFKSNADFLSYKKNIKSYLIDDISIDVVDVCFKYDNIPFLLRAYLKYRENIESVTIKVQALFTKNVLYKLKKEKTIYIYFRVLIYFKNYEYLVYCPNRKRN